MARFAIEECRDVSIFTQLMSSHLGRDFDRSAAALAPRSSGPLT
jgi:hypothetical protein